MSSCRVNIKRVVNVVDKEIILIKWQRKQHDSREKTNLESKDTEKTVEETLITYILSVLDMFVCSSELSSFPSDNCLRH